MSITTENDNIYMNIVINGNKPNYPFTLGSTVTGEEPVIAQYVNNKTIPFLGNPSEYYASVIRFTIPLNNIPLFIMPIIPNQPSCNPPAGVGDTTRSTLVIGIRYLGVNYSEYVQYFADNDFPEPKCQTASSMIITDYYYVYSYASLLKMLNITLNNVWILSGLAAINPGVVPPYFYYDPQSELISFIVPALFAGGIASIFVNQSALQYLQGFEYSFNGYNNTQGDDYYFIFQNQNAYFYPPWDGMAATSNYYKYIQEYNTLYYWASLRKILILSNNIPILNEVVPSNNNTGVSASLPVITDFIPQISRAGDTRSIAFYNPTGQYRLVDLSGMYPLSNIDIKLMWQDVNGNTYPIYISNNQQIEIKIGFFKKSLYKKSMDYKR